MAVEPIKTMRDEYAENVIRKLEEFLTIAKDNPQASVVIAMVGRDDKIRETFSTLSRYELIGALETLKVKVMGFG